MNERLIIQLEQDGKQLPINSISNEGVRISTEEDTWPSGLALGFNGDTAITRYRMDRVRTLNGWEPGQYKMDVHLESGNIVFTGVTAEGLPAGSYWFSLRIADYKVSSKRYRFKLDENGEATVSVEVSRDPRHVELTGALSTFDSEIARVLTHAESRLDGSALENWLANPSPRARRKACVLNVLAKLRSAPLASAPLIKDVRYLFFADVDRIYTAVNGNFYTQLVTLAKDPKKPFYAEGTPKSAGHRKLLERIKKFESDVSKFQLRSFRQEGKNSMQAVVAIPTDGLGADRYYADIDIDLGNPLQDVQGFVIHIGELLDSGTTDHLALYSKLAKDTKVSPYLYYKVVKLQ